jgi:pilus assembly protein FimV
MSLRYVVRALILVGLMPAGALALGLGDIHLKSALNAPLDAEIDLTATAEELRGLKVALASRESFARYGLDYPAYFDTVTLVPGKSGDGHDVLQVHSNAVATEPFATLLIEATWARGRLVREYTVLLDPPVFTGDKPSAAAAVAAPEVASQARSGSVERPAPSQQEAPSAPSEPVAPSAPAPAMPASPVSSDNYVVQRGDTLSAIAAQHYPNAERERALVALYNANPTAFEGNMNVLHAGASLRVPDEASLASIAPGEAKSEVSTQYHAWAGTHADGGHLHLVPPSEPGTAPPGKAAAGETAALQQRVTTLEGQLTEAQRLLEVKNAELAQLQKQLNPGNAAPPAPPPSVKTPEVAQNPPAKETPAPVATAPAEAPPPAPTPAAKPVPPKHAQAVAAHEEGGGLLDWLISKWYVLLAVLVAVMAAIFGVRRVKAGREQDFSRTFDRLGPPFDAGAASRPAETQPMRTLQSRQDSSFVVEESGTHPVPRMGGGESAPLRAAPVAVDDALSASGTAVALDQGDPLAEADFHMAYGLYDQAADLVRIAISREPQRRDLQLKLLEVYFVWGNKDQFLSLARELSANRDQAMAGEWEKIVIMGRQIAPDDALFASAGGLAGVGNAGVDLNLEGGQNRVDFDLLGDPSVVTESSGDAVDLDLGAALGGSEVTGEARAVGDTGVDFILDDPARGGDATGSTREMLQSPTVTLDFGDPSPDSPTVENLMTPDVESPTIRQKLDASSRHLLQTTEATAELAVVDLGLHVSGADTGQYPVSEDETGRTALRGLDEDTRELFSKAHSAAQDTQLMPSSPGGTASGTWLFTDKDMGVDLPAAAPADDAPTALATAIMPGTAAGQGLTAQLEALKGHGSGGDVDLDLGGLDMTGEPGGALDLDVGNSSASSEGAFGATQRLSGQPALNESEPATMSEVGTKLDLARAYMDMGDPEGARSILEEVLAEGSASQKTEARRLVDSLPG